MADKKPHFEKNYFTLSNTVHLTMKPFYHLARMINMDVCKFMH